MYQITQVCRLSGKSKPEYPGRELIIKIGSSFLLHYCNITVMLAVILDSLKM